MLILGIETSNGKCSVSLSLENQILYSLYNSENSKQAEYLVVMTQQVMKKSGYNFEDIDYVATSVGPGSFTGIRIGISAAKGFALALGKPIIGITNFDTIFYRINRQVNYGDLVDYNKLAVINAYRDEIYVGMSINNVEQAPQLIHKSALNDLTNKYEGYLVIAGSGAIDFYDILVQSPELREKTQILPRFPIPDARFICKVAYEKIIKNDFADASPLYIRPPDAKPLFNRISLK